MNYKNKYRLFTLLAIFLTLFSTGCQNFPGAYTLDIEQGNEIEEASLNKLKPGMSEEQVRFLLGTPMLKDIFHADRWDYVYYLNKKHKVREKKHLVVYFDQGKVTRIDGNYANEVTG